MKGEIWRGEGDLRSFTERQLLRKRGMEGQIERKRLQGEDRDGVIKKKRLRKRGGRLEEKS